MLSGNDGYTPLKEESTVPSSSTTEPPKKIFFRPMPPTSPAGNTAARAHRREFLRQQQMAKQQQQQQQHQQQQHHQQQPLSESRRSPTRSMISGIPVKSPFSVPTKPFQPGAIPVKQRSSSATSQQQAPPLMRNPILATTSSSADTFSANTHTRPTISSSKPAHLFGSVSSMTSTVSVLATPSFSTTSSSLGRSVGHDHFHRSHQVLSSSQPQAIPISSRIPKPSGQRTHVLNLVDQWEHKATIRKVSSSLPTTTSSASLLKRDLSLSTGRNKASVYSTSSTAATCFDIPTIGQTRKSIEETRKMVADTAKSLVEEVIPSNVIVPLPEAIFVSQKKSPTKSLRDSSGSTSLLLSKTDPMRRPIDTSPIMEGLGCESMGDTRMVVPMLPRLLKPCKQALRAILEIPNMEFQVCSGLRTVQVLQAEYPVMRPQHATIDTVFSLVQNENQRLEQKLVRDLFLVKEFGSKPFHEVGGNASPPRAPLLSLAHGEVLARSKMETGAMEKSTNRATSLYEGFDSEECLNLNDIQLELYEGLEDFVL